jgi:hypothetical protein
MNARTSIKFSGLERSRYNNLLSVKFELSVHGKRDYVMAETTSAALFRSYGAAIKGARRAVAAFERTGKFPNMCAPF